MNMATPITDENELRRLQSERGPLSEPSFWRRLLAVLVMRGEP